jgi:hypothetical protein
MILLDNIVEVFALTDDDGGAMFLIIVADSRGIGLAAINGNLLRDPMTADRFGQKPLGRVLVPMFGQEEIDGLTMLIDGAIEVGPRAFHPDVRLVHAPADPHRALAAMKCLFQRGTVFHDPALEGRVVDRDPTLCHQLFDMTVAQGIGHNQRTPTRMTSCGK